MLKRFFVHLCLISLFALTQIGIAVHEISHLNHPAKQTHSDKNTGAEQCGQCIAYAQSANAMPTAAFVVPVNEVQFEFSTAKIARLTALLSSPYSARAPPISLDKTT